MVEYLKSILLQPTRELFVLFHSTGLHAILAHASPFIKPIEKCLFKNSVSHKYKGVAAELYFYNEQNVFSDLSLR